MNAGPNVTHTYASMGNYTIWLNVTDGNGTFYSDSLIVRIYPALAIAPAVSPLQSDAPASITYNAVPSGGAPLVGVTWNFSDGFSTHAVSGSHTVHSPGNYTAAVVVRDAAGEARFANFSLQVHPKIGVVSHLTPVVGIVPFLVNGTAALSGGTGPFAPTWDFGVGPSGINDSLNASYQYTLAGNYAVRFLASDALGGIAQDDYTVLALLPIKTFANATPLDGVRPFGTTFAVNALGGGGTFNYTWEFGDGSGNGYGRIADHTYASIGTYPVLVIARDQYGFTANSSLTVQVVEPLNATLQYSGRLGVAPYTVHLTALPTGGLGNDSFVWTFGDGGVASSGNTQTHDYLEYGNYSIYALVTDGIGDHYSLSGSIEVVQPLEARLVVEPGSGALGTLETFTATASQGYGPYTFDWSGLPTGCLLGNVSEGTCNGTAAGSFNVTVEVSDRLGEHLIEISPLQLTPNSASGPAAGGTSTPFTSEVVLGIVGITLLIVALAAFLFWRRSRPPTSVEEDATDPYAIPTAGEDPSMQGTEPPGDA
ncbi:MAG: PKD domain-containing protein [Thermoplasmata archaeon]|nr:PKD domain-containing protein [Thermoplasmata archaeon]